MIDRSRFPLAYCVETMALAEAAGYPHTAEGVWIVRQYRGHIDLDPWRDAPKIDGWRTRAGIPTAFPGSWWNS